MTSSNRLKLGMIHANDAGKGIIRLDPKLMAEKGLKEGDIILLDGPKQAAVAVKKGYAEDAGTKVGRVDGMIRRNADIEIGMEVEFRKIDRKTAKSVSLIPQTELRLKGGQALLATLLSDIPVMKGNFLDINIMGNRYLIEVASFLPTDAEAVVIDAATRMKFGGDKQAQVAADGRSTTTIPHLVYEDIGGLDGEIERMREMVELPLNHPELFERLGVEPPKGVLLHGPPGTGKTLLAKAVASETQSSFFYIAGPEIMSKFYGESEEKIRKIFDRAKQNAPSIIFIDEIDSIAPKRDETSHEMERRIVAQILTLMDGMEARGEVVIIGATNRPNSLDPALRRPGRFDREIVIATPRRKGRLEILQIHSRGMPMAEDVSLEALADITHGFVGADLHALCKEAALNSLRNVMDMIKVQDDEIPAEVLKELRVQKEDFLNAFRGLEPSAMREVLIKKPNVKWEQIGGLSEAKQDIIESVQWPLVYPAMYEHLDVFPPKGIILYGPPGTGKTLLAKAVATETEANFISIKGAEFHSKWLGESEKAVRETFRKAKQASPCIVFFDEIDAIAPTRTSGGGESQAVERVVSQLLIEMDGIESLHGVVLMAATNRLDIIDPALLRPGRFDRHILVGIPNEDARMEIIGIHTCNKPLAPEVDLDEVCRQAEGFTGADLSNLCNEAGMLALREYVGEMCSISSSELTPQGEIIRLTELNSDDKGRYTIGKRHFDLAFRKVRPSVKDAEKYMSEYDKNKQPMGEGGKNKEVLVGKAANSKAGPVVVCGNGRVVHITGIDPWDDDVVGRMVEVTGLVKDNTCEIPKASVDKDGAISQGIEGDAEVVKNASWKLHDQ